MLFKFIIIALSLTINHAKHIDEKQFTIEVPKDKVTPNEDMMALIDEFISETNAKLKRMEKIISQKLADTLVVKLEKYMTDKHSELENNIEKLTKLIDFNLNVSNTINNELYKENEMKNEKLIKAAIKEIEEENRKLIQKERQDIKTSMSPGNPEVNPDKTIFAIVEIDETASAYEEIVKKKDSADVSVAWTTKCGAPADKARVILNGTEMWSGAGNVTSASFKVSKGGRYQMTVELCNKNGCKYSNATEIIIADTDGSHLPPLEFSGKPNQTIGSTNQPKQSSGKIVGAYFMEWGVYEKKYPVDHVPVSDLTHLLYSLIPICGGEDINNSLKNRINVYEGLQRSCNGRGDFKVTIHDTWAALKMPLRSSPSENVPYKGNFGELMVLKKANPELKMLMSIGGWTLSDPFYFFAEKTKRDIFIASVKDFLQTWKFFDGIDIMWIYPKSLRDGNTYVQLMKELREMLNELSIETSKKYELTSAISAKWDLIQVVDYNEAQKYMDKIFLNSNSFGDLDSSPRYYANLYAPVWNPQESYTTDNGTKCLLAQGVKPDKIVLGLCMYGFGWTGIHDYKNDNPFNGKATGNVNGTWEKGVVYYNQIANEINQDKWEYHYDSVAEVPYVFRKETGDLITYENVRSTTAKAKYVRDNQLGGMFVRGIDADNGDIMNAIHIGLGNRA